MTGWGKAGERLTNAEQQQRRTARARRRFDAARAHDRMLAEGHRLWAAGKLVPAAITMHLGVLDGPEVDAACLAVEPEVDQWEAGILYPTWEQTAALAALCRCSVAALTMRPVPIQSTSLWLHMDAGERASYVEPVWAFTQAALEHRLGVLA